MMDIHEVREYLPHRYPFLLVDRVVSVEPGKRIEAYKNVSINEPFFNGHFPQEPIMPGVLIIEALAQAAGILGFVTENKRPGESIQKPSTPNKHTVNNPTCTIFSGSAVIVVATHQPKT